MVRCVAARSARPAAALLRNCKMPRSIPSSLHGSCCFHPFFIRHIAGTQLAAPAFTNSSRAAVASGATCSAAGSSNVEASSIEGGRLLNACIGPGLQLHEQAYSIEGRLLRLLSPADVDAVLDQYISTGLDRDPYWCRAWPSAMSLARQLLQRPHLVAGKKVADFGAGLGVAGLAAALAGAQEVVLLDREPLALCCGLLSAAATGVAGVTGLAQLLQQVELEAVGSSSSGSSCSPPPGAVQEQQQQQQQQEQQQQWRQGLLQLAADLGRRQPAAVAECVYRAQPFDWGSSSVTERFDVVLACDVLYEAEAVDPVAAVIPKLLKPGGDSLLLLADPPNRTVANRQRFLEQIAAAQPTPLLLQESGVEECSVQQLDPEMLGGVMSESVTIQFMVFRTAVGNDTIGLKSL